MTFNSREHGKALQHKLFPFCLAFYSVSAGKREENQTKPPTKRPPKTKEQKNPNENKPNQ